MSAYHSVLHDALHVGVGGAQRGALVTELCEFGILQRVSSCRRCGRCGVAFERLGSRKPSRQNNQDEDVNWIANARRGRSTVQESQERGDVQRIGKQGQQGDMPRISRDPSGETDVLRKGSCEMPNATGWCMYFSSRLTCFSRTPMTWPSCDAMAARAASEPDMMNEAIR